jgi:hypothetical protein
MIARRGVASVVAAAASQPSSLAHRTHQSSMTKYQYYPVE